VLQTDDAWPLSLSVYHPAWGCACEDPEDRPIWLAALDLCFWVDSINVTQRDALFGDSGQLQQAYERACSAFAPGEQVNEYYHHVRLCATPAFVRDLYFLASKEYCVPEATSGFQLYPRLARDGVMMCGTDIGPVGPTQSNEEADCPCNIFFDYDALANSSSTAVHSVSTFYAVISQPNSVWPVRRPFTRDGECACDDPDFRPVWLAPIDMCDYYARQPAEVQALLLPSDFGAEGVYERACLGLSRLAQNHDYMHVKFCADRDFIVDIFYEHGYCQRPDESGQLVPRTAPDGLLFCQGTIPDPRPPPYPPQWALPAPPSAPLPPACSSTPAGTCAAVHETCVLDLTCLTPELPLHGGLGCNAGGYAMCRFCGFGQYAGCVLQPPSPPFAHLSTTANNPFGTAFAGGEQPLLSSLQVQLVSGAGEGACATNTPVDTCPYSDDTYASMLNCEDAASGDFCEGDGECGTDRDLDNCDGDAYSNFDVYVKGDVEEDDGCPSGYTAVNGSTIDGNAYYASGGGQCYEVVIGDRIKQREGSGCSETNSYPFLIGSYAQASSTNPFISEYEGGTNCGSTPREGTLLVCVEDVADTISEAQLTPDEPSMCVYTFLLKLPQSMLTQDPHFTFPYGGRGDFRGIDQTTFAFVSGPQLAANIKTEDAAFTLHGLHVDGSFVTEFHLVAGPAFNATIRAASANENLWSWRMVQGMCNGRSFTLGPHTSKTCGNSTMAVDMNSVFIDVAPWTFKVRVNHVFNSVSGPTKRLDISSALNQKGVDYLYGAGYHGLLGQAFMKHERVDGRVDVYPSSGRFKTSAQLEGAIEGGFKDYIVAGPYGTAFAYSLYSSSSAPAPAPSGVLSASSKGIAYASVDDLVM